MISGSIVPENIRNHSDIAKNIDKKTNKNIAKFFDKITEVLYQLGIGILYNEPSFHMHYR